MDVFEREVRDGLLAVRVGGNNGTRLISLEGEMDLANASVAEAALREVVAGSSVRIIVDMRQLSFIDSTGIALLVHLLREDGGTDRLRFLPSQFEVVTRVLRLTGLDERLTRLESSS